MSGVKGRSGGRRRGTGPKNIQDLRQLHERMDACVGDGDWNSIIGALVKKAKKGDVAASRELRAWRFGQIPIAPPVTDEEPIEPIRIIRTIEPCERKHVDDDDELVQSDELTTYESSLQSEED